MGARVSTITVGSAATLALWINRVLEVLWLLTVMLVPLSFLSGGDILGSPVVFLLELPKVAALRTLAGLMAGLWLIECCILGRFSPNDLVMGLRKVEIDPGKWWRAIDGWVNSQPT